MKKLVAVVVSLVLLMTVAYIAPSSWGEVKGVFTTTSVKQVKVNISSAKVRTGASTSHSVITYLPKGRVVDVIGKIGNWYVIKTAGDTVGCIYSSSVIPYNPNPVTPAPAPTTPPGDTSNMQTEMLNYINAARAENGVAPLVLDKALCDGAYLKSKDMVDNNYFDHNSPTYGSPFEMMQKLNISFSWAGENIAKHISIKGAHEGLMNSPGHRANILKPEFKKIGIGIVKDGSYLYITQWFTD